MTAAGTARRIERAAGKIATQAVTRMDATLPWFRAMPADQRAWVGLVVQAGIASFVVWLRRPSPGTGLPGDVFGTAPRALARSVTLQQTVELVRAAIDTIEEHVATLAAPGDEALLRVAVLRYSREIAFATALVYARTAEERGAWDARLEALVVDAVLRGEADAGLLSRAAALGWSAGTPVAVLAGHAPAGEPEAVLDAIARAARRAGAYALGGFQGDRLVVIVGAADPVGAADLLAGEFGDGPVVLGPTVSDLATAETSAAAAIGGLRAAAAWPGAPRPVPATELLAERALAGDPGAVTALLEEVYTPLADAGGHLLDTVAAYLESAGSLEATARLLFVHPNTVRYRLRRSAEITGHSPSDPRSAFVLRLALAFGRLAGEKPVL
ncbi:MAG TPA: helix-turn-helix domain-containing protein [Mycobacteriales bacterium]|nr:helix-turn-helix domain-containing protein [Mycobacteriales bacterium]